MGEQERWQVSGSAAEKYELFVASWFAAWADDLIERAGLAPGQRILDLACGTGIVTRAAGPVIGPTGHITASDINEGMLAEAQRHPVEGAPVLWQQADATELPFGTDEFDVLLCQQGLQFLPDKGAAVSEMRRVLRPGGLAGVSVWRTPDHNPYIAALADGLSRYLSPQAGEIMLAPCGFGESRQLDEVFTGSGFSSVEILPVTIERAPADPAEAIGGNLAALPISDQIEAMDPTRYDEMIDHIAEVLDPHVVNGKLTAPNSAYVVLAEA